MTAVNQLEETDTHSAHNQEKQDKGSVRKTEQIKQVEDASREYHENEAYPGIDEGKIPLQARRGFVAQESRHQEVPA